MSLEATAAAPPVARHVRWVRWMIGLLVLAVLGAVANLLGWDIRGWFESLWDTMSAGAPPWRNRSVIRRIGRSTWWKKSW